MVVCYLVFTVFTGIENNVAGEIKCYVLGKGVVL
jgi:hypothetical protein